MIRRWTMTALVLIGLASTGFNVYQVWEVRTWMDDNNPAEDCAGYDSCWEALTYAQYDLDQK